MTKKLPDYDTLSKIFGYSRSTGLLRFIRGAAIRPAANNSYMRVTVSGQSYFAHRIIWKLQTGNDPDRIDHINGNTWDNRLANLRNVETRSNALNKSLPNDRVAPYGVFRKDGLWCVREAKPGGRKIIGRFKRLKSAAICRKKSESASQFDYNVNHSRMSFDPFLPKNNLPGLVRQSQIKEIQKASASGS